MMFWLIIKFIFFIYVLAHSGTWLVKILSRISSYFKVSYFAVAFMIMAAATSVPELMIGINSALDKMPQLSLGVVLGSNIADLALVFGVALILSKHISLDSLIAKRDAWYMVLITLLPIFLLYDKVLSRFDGIILLLAFSLFSYQIFWSKQHFLKSFDDFNQKTATKLLHLLKNFTWFVVALGIMLVSAKYVVDFGEQLAIFFSIPLIIIGITILALSTSLPELVFEVKAITSGKKGMALGDLVGSLVANSSLILGITAVIYPIQIENSSAYFVAVLYLILLLIFFILNIAKPLSRNIGYLLVFSYLIFLLIEFYR